jgi:hypothetical protein
MLTGRPVREGKRGKILFMNAFKCKVGRNQSKKLLNKLEKIEYLYVTDLFVNIDCYHSRQIGLVELEEDSK